MSSESSASFCFRQEHIRTRLFAFPFELTSIVDCKDSPQAE